MRTDVEAYIVPSYILGVYKASSIKEYRKNEYTKEKVSKTAKKTDVCAGCLLKSSCMGRMEHTEKYCRSKII